MSFGIGASDIVAGIKLAIRIYDYGLAEPNRADVRYRNFKNEILNFKILLERLGEALEGAEQRYQTRGPDIGLQLLRPKSDDFEKERKLIIGNFMVTLKECQELLEKHKQFQERDSNILDNIRVNLSHQAVRIDHLRHRLHFHSQKIRLVVDRLSLNLLRDIDAKVDDVLAISEENLQVSNEIKLMLTMFRASFIGYISGNGVPATSAFEGSHAVSSDIAQRFRDKMSVNAPSNTQTGLPLAESFDALLLHYEQCSTPGSDQTPESYLLFLKTRWLLDRVKEGREYQLARPGYYYKRAVNYVEQGILSRVTELISYDDNTLLCLPDTHFDIWPVPPELPALEYIQPHPLMDRGTEEIVAQINLASHVQGDADSVTVFKRSEEHFRVVLRCASASAPNETLVIPQLVNIREDKLVPRYALPTLSRPCLELSIFSRSEETFYTFQSLPSLHALQTALMGHEVSHDQGDMPVRCQLKFHNVTKLFDTSGRVQLWQEPIGPLPSSGLNNPRNPRSLRSASISQGSHSRHDSLNLSLPPTSTITVTGEGWEAATIRLPSIAVFTQLLDSKGRAKFAVIFLQLQPGIYVDARKCSCHRDYNTCANIVISHSRRPYFPAYILESESTDNGQPNPNTFDIFPLRLPRHPDFDRLTTRKETEKMILNFKNLTEKERFYKELKLRFRVRDTQIERQQEFEKRILYEQDHPRPHRQSLSPTVNQELPVFRSSMTYLPSPTGSRSGSNAGTVSVSPSSPSPNATEETIPAAEASLMGMDLDRDASISSTKQQHQQQQRQDTMRTTRTNSNTTARPSTSSSSRFAFQSELTSSKKRSSETPKKSIWKLL